MCKKIFFTGFMLMAIHITVCSQIYFSKRYNNEGLWSYSQNILEHSSGYFLSFVTPGINSQSRRIGFLSLDFNGNIMGPAKIYTDLESSVETGYPGSFIKLGEDSNYACLGTKMKGVPEGRYDRGWLLKLNNSLDTIWTKMYTDDPPHDTSILFRNFRELSDGGYIAVGLVNPVSGTGFFRIGMFRLDDAGTLLWKRVYGTGNIHFQPFDVSPTSDKGYIIGAIYEPLNGPSTQGDDPYIIKIDSVGNQQWNLHLGNPDCRENYAMVDLARDGNIQVGTIFSDTCWSDDVWMARINFLKIGNNKTIVWDKKYGFAKVWLETSKIKVLPDGDIIGTGWYWYYPGTGVRVISWIIRTDSAGNERWYREYSLLNGLNSLNYLCNTIPTSDGGFAACGYVVPLQPDTGTEDSWVLKVDSLGCESPGNCWVGIDEIGVKTFTPDKPFVVYPNPASDKFTIEFHSNPEGAEIEVFNIYGKRCVKESMPPLAERMEIDVRSFISGIYVVKVNMGNNIFSNERLLVHH